MSARARRAGAGLGGGDGLETRVGGKHCGAWCLTNARDEDREVPRRAFKVLAEAEEGMNGWMEAEGWSLTVLSESSLSLVFGPRTEQSLCFLCPGGDGLCCWKDVFPIAWACPERRQELHLEQYSGGSSLFGFTYLTHLEGDGSSMHMVLYHEVKCSIITCLKKCYKFLTTNQLCKSFF